MSQSTLQSDNVIKATALIYLQDAIVRDQYQEAQALVNQAKELGVLDADIEQAIVSAIDTINGVCSGDEEEQVLNRIAVYTQQED